MIGRGSARRAFKLCWGLVAVLALAACALTVDADEARLCRQVAAGVDGGGHRLNVLSARSLLRTATPLRGPAEGVEITYRRASPSETASEAHTVGCLFDPARPGLKPAERLIGIEVDGLPLSASRLYMLKRFWLDTVDGGTDPDPVPGAAAALEIPRPFAIAAQSLIAALPQMGLLALLAAAYGLVYGLLGRINLAFGDLVTVGGYAALIGLVMTGPGIGVAIVTAIGCALWAAMGASALAGHVVFAPLNMSRGQAPMIASAGLALVLAETVRLAKAGGPKSSPPLLNEPIALARASDYLVTITPMQILVTALAGGAIAVVLTGLARTALGRAWRACCDDPFAAALLGLSPVRIHLATFAASGLLAGLGGAIAALAYGSLSYAGGLVVGLKALIAALLAGAGSIGGAVLCGLAIGLAEALWSATLPIEHRDAMLFTILVLMLVLRPGGLFGAPALERKIG